MQLEQDARRDVVGLDGAVLDQRDDLGWRRRRWPARIGAGDDPLDLPRVGEVIDPVDAVHVAGGDGVEERQVAALAVGGEPGPEGREHGVRAAEAA